MDRLTTRMRARTRTLAMTCLLAAACALTAPQAAFAVTAPEGATIDEAVAWAQGYLDGEGALTLLAADEGRGFELLARDDGAFDLQAITVDTSWYAPGQATYTLGSATQLAGLQQLVANGTTFEGATVALANDVVYINAQIEPIGSPEAPFAGTFDGAGNTLRGWALVTEDDLSPASYLGFFGFCTGASELRDVSIEQAAVTVTRSASSTYAATNIGSLVGRTDGSVRGVTSRATLDINVDTPQTSQVTSVVENIGGIAGAVRDDVEDCHFGGAVRVHSNTAGSEVKNSYGISVGNYVGNSIGGVVGRLGSVDASAELGSASADDHGSISDCSCSGLVRAIAPSTAGKDRFGTVITVQVPAVGGIAGISLGSIYNCEFTGRVYAPQTSMAGGIVGSLRSSSWTGLGDNSTMDTGSADDWIVIDSCKSFSGSWTYGEAENDYEDRFVTRYGAGTVKAGMDAPDVEGLQAVGGIAGSAGSYTTITRCSNDAWVRGDRWNKPSIGGVVGQSRQTVSYCYNTGTVESLTLAGYYTAGIAGMSLFYTDLFGNPNTPQPEVYSCYNAGRVLADAGMRNAALVGQNEGYLHDSYALSGTAAPDDKLAAEEDSTGTVAASCAFLDADEMLGSTLVAKLNTLLNGTLDWSDYYVVQPAETGAFPQLRSLMDPQPAATDLAAIAPLEVVLAENASYSGGEAVPRVSVTAADGTALVQDVDFRVVPQAGAVDLGAGYVAAIEGIGWCTGTVEGACEYTIDKGDLATCTASFQPQKFDYNEKTIPADNVTVVNALGGVLDPSWYTYEFRTSVYEGSNQAYQGMELPVRYLSATGTTNYSDLAPEWSAEGIVNAGFYPVTVTATDEAPFTGTVEGRFQVQQASLMSDVTIEAMEWQGKTYAWNQGNATFSGGTPVLDYTGDHVTPGVTRVTYLGHELVEGQDYMVIWGSANSTDSTARYADYDNIGAADENAVACATVRFKSGGKPYNFNNYANMFFCIHGPAAPAVPDLADLTVTAHAQLGNGNALTPVKVTYADGAEVSREDISVAYEDNIEVGTASYTVRGKRLVTGEVSGTFEIFGADDPRAGLVPYQGIAAASYSDLAAGAWYVKETLLDTDTTYLDYVTAKGIMGGSGGTFRPTGAVKREMVATVLYRMATGASADDPVDPQGSSVFTDVAGGKYYTAAVKWCYENGVVTGNGDKFGVGNDVTREQLAAMVHRYCQKFAGAGTGRADLSQFTDEAQIHSYSRDAVAYCVDAGIMTGKGTRFAPTEGANRAQLAKVLSLVATA